MSDTVPPVDWAPVLQLMALGVLLALGPLVWVWLRHRRAGPLARLHALTVLTLFLTFDLVLFGAFTRLTDSGLGCPDWPGCYGAASPIGARAEIRAAEAAMPTGPVTPRKAWIEMIHRYLATAVGVLILMLAVLTAVERRRGRRPSTRPQGPPTHRGAGVGPESANPAMPHAAATTAAAVEPLPVGMVWPLLTLVWVCVQGAFGALTVTMKLFPAIVTLHLIGGLTLLALLTVQAVRYREAAWRLPPLPVSRALLGALVALLLLVAVQVALGGWVSTNYAVLACTDFPTCHGRWWPEMDFAQGFQIWRELGQTRAGDNLSFAALTAIHYTHRLAAYAVLMALALMAGWLWRRADLRWAARWLAGLALWQLATGVSNVVFTWPLLAAVAHTGGAAGLVVVICAVLTRVQASKAVCAPAARTRARPGIPGPGALTPRGGAR